MNSQSIESSLFRNKRKKNAQSFRLQTGTGSMKFWTECECAAMDVGWTHIQNDPKSFETTKGCFEISNLFSFTSPFVCEEKGRPRSMTGNHPLRVAETTADWQKEEQFLGWNVQIVSDQNVAEQDGEVSVKSFPVSKRKHILTVEKINELCY